MTMGTTEKWKRLRVTIQDWFTTVCGPQTSHVPLHHMGLGNTCIPADLHKTSPSQTGACSFVLGKNKKGVCTSGTVKGKMKNETKKQSAYESWAPPHTPLWFSQTCSQASPPMMKTERLFSGEKKLPKVKCINKYFYRNNQVSSSKSALEKAPCLKARPSDTQVITFQFIVSHYQI